MDRIRQSSGPCMVARNCGRLERSACPTTISDGELSVFIVRNQLPKCRLVTTLTRGRLRVADLLEPTHQGSSDGTYGFEPRCNAGGALRVGEAAMARDAEGGKGESFLDAAIRIGAVG